MKHYHIYANIFLITQSYRFLQWIHYHICSLPLYTVVFIDYELQALHTLSNKINQFTVGKWVMNCAYKCSTIKNDYLFYNTIVRFPRI